MRFNPSQKRVTTTRYYKYLIYNTPIYKNNTLSTYTPLNKLEFILRILDFNLKLSSKSKQDSYLRNLIRKNKINKYKLKLLLIIRISLNKKIQRDSNLIRAFEGK